MPAGTGLDADGAGRRELTRRLERLAPTEGAHPSDWPGLEVLRTDRPRGRQPVVYRPCVCIVAQGAKRAYLGGEVLTYDALRYLVLSVPLPMEAEILEASPERPFLALRLHLESPALGELLLEAGDEPGQRPRHGAQRGIYVSRLGDELFDAVLRLLAALDHPRDRRVLAPLAEREVLYRLLTGDQGAKLREMVLRDSRSHRVARVVHYLHAHYDQPLDVATIAGAAHMSPSTLHHAFKEVTASSPLRYLKSIRLHQARLLMLHDGLNAGEAAHRVGYSSDSQFNREYRRLFGAPPRRDVAALREEGRRGPARAAFPSAARTAAGRS